MSLRLRFYSIGAVFDKTEVLVYFISFNCLNLSATFAFNFNFAFNKNSFKEKLVVIFTAIFFVMDLSHKRYMLYGTCYYNTIYSGVKAAQNMEKQAVKRSVVDNKKTNLVFEFFLIQTTMSANAVILYSERLPLDCMCKLCKLVLLGRIGYTTNKSK